MNNSRSAQLIFDCNEDFDRISNIINELGSTHNSIPFLTKYAIIKACGTLEQCFKTIISDFSIKNQNQQVTRFIDCTFRESSMNPNLDNICKALSNFDIAWKQTFKSLLKWDINNERITRSIKSLNNARNQFAHGWNPIVTFNDIVLYFNDVQTVIWYIDSSVK
jgi:hypothetical protein